MCLFDVEGLQYCGLQRRLVGWIGFYAGAVSYRRSLWLLALIVDAIDVHPLSERVVKLDSAM